MSVPYPKIVYPASGGTPTTVNFTYPPTTKAAAYPVIDHEAVGVATVTISGKRQVWFLRSDNLMRVTLENVPWSDMPTWEAFVLYAQQGGSFLYYPDGTGTAYDEFWLEDTGGSGRSQTPIMSWNPTGVKDAKMLAAFELTFRKVPGGMTHS